MLPSAVFVLLVNIVWKARQIVHNAHPRSIPFQARQVVEVVVRIETIYLIKFKIYIVFHRFIVYILSQTTQKDID